MLFHTVLLSIMRNCLKNGVQVICKRAEFFVHARLFDFYYFLVQRFD